MCAPNVLYEFGAVSRCKDHLRTLDANLSLFQLEWDRSTHQERRARLPPTFPKDLP